MISSFVGREPQDVVKRWDRKSRRYVDVRRPQAVEQYNKHMGGVDLTDRMVAHYPHGIKSRKFYLRIIFHFLNVCLINAWILYRSAKQKNVPLMDFKASVATTLIKLDGREGKRGRTSHSPSPSTLLSKKKKTLLKTPMEIRTDGINHYPTKIPCKNPPRCHERSCIKRTRYACKKCKEPVCPECMEAFHM